MPRYRVRAAMWVKAATIFLGLFTIGMLPLMGWVFLRDRRVKWIDEEGVETPSGRKYAWEDLTKLHTGVAVSGPSAIRTFTLHFGDKAVAIWGTFEEGGGREAIAYVHKILADRGIQVVTVDGNA